MLLDSPAAFKCSSLKNICHLYSALDVLGDVSGTALRFLHQASSSMAYDSSPTTERFSMDEERDGSLPGGDPEDGPAAKSQDDRLLLTGAVNLLPLLLLFCGSVSSMSGMGARVWYVRNAALRGASGIR